MLLFVIAVIVAGPLSLALAVLLKRKWAGWSIGKAAAVASLPLPVLAAGFSAVFFVHAVTERRCVLGCDLALMMGAAFIMLAAILWLVGFMTAWLGLRSRL